MRLKISFSKQWLQWFFLLVWYFQVTYFTTIGWIDSLFTVGKICSFAIMLFIFWRDRSFSVSNFFIYMVMYQGILLLITLYQGGVWITHITYAASILGLIFSLEYMFKKNCKDAINVLMVIFELIIYANFITVVLFPKGLYNVEEDATRFYWLVGHQNQTILYVLCAIVLATLYSRYVKGSITLVNRSKLLIIASIATIIMIWSATAVAGLSIMIIVLILDKMNIKLNTKQAIIVSLAVFLTFVVFQWQQYFSVIIVDMLKRELTFSRRTRIWENALYYIERKPLLGYGVEADIIAKMRFGFSTCHNKYLYILYQGGMVLFSCFLVLLFTVAKKLDAFVKEYGVIILIGVIWALLIQMQFESYTSVVFFLPFILGMNIDKIIYEKEIENT